MPRHLDHHLHLRQRESAGCRRRRRSAAESARWRWCRRRRGRGCTAPTSARPTRRRSWSWGGSRADGPAGRPAASRRSTSAAGTPDRAARHLAARGAAVPTPKSTPRASAPSTSTVGARRRAVVVTATRYPSRPGAPADGSPPRSRAGPGRGRGESGRRQSRRRVSAGHCEETGRRTFVRFSISSTSTRTAVRSCRPSVAGVTTVAREIEQDVASRWPRVAGCRRCWCGGAVRSQPGQRRRTPAISEDAASASRL